jgi:NAD dependent epimerase/dehydratase family enzyme
VTNREFSRILAGELRRPGVLPAPAFALRLLMGEMADALVLGGQRVLPRKAEEGGYSFRYPYLGPAIHAIYG